jgi:protein-S-isoprenylcysteine O-methyltransferase Ste14
MNAADRPNRIPWPPILFFSCLAAAAILGRIAPIGPLTSTGGLAVMGWLIVVGALALMGWTFLTFAQAPTTIMPHRRSDALIETGPFAFSRNPIYLSEILLLIGLGFTEQPLWYLIAAYVFWRLVTRLAVEREEAHLAARFGPAWEAYAGRVRRWV